jgi:hypothetical protein
MIKGRVWRFLMLFFGVYLFFLLYFLRSFSSDTVETTTTSPLPHAKVKPIEPKIELIKPSEQPIVRSTEANSSSLEPVMKKGVLGNYEPLNLVKVPGPGENGEGVQLQGEEEKKLGEKSVGDYGFNEVASEKISLDRHARDTRYDKTQKNDFLNE